MKRTSLILASAVAAAAISMTSSASADILKIGGIKPDYSQLGLGCNGCEIFQRTVSTGTSYASPYNGTITEFRVQVGPTPDVGESVQPFVVRSIGSGQYQLIGTTASTNISSTPAHAVAKIPTSIAVLAGDSIGLKYNTSKIAGSWSPAGSSENDKVVPWGGGYTPGATYTPGPTDGTGQQRVNLEATLSYSLPLDQGPPLKDTVAPLISNLKSKNAKFRVNPKGPVLTARAPKGTKFTFNSSENANVTFTISRSSKSAKTKRTTFKKVNSLRRLAESGTNTLPFSGRYRDLKGKTRALKPGKYKLTLTPIDKAGNVGIPQSVSFKIVS